MKYKRLLEIDGAPVKLKLELDKNGEIDDCVVAFYGPMGAVRMSWWDKARATKELDKLILELTKFRGKMLQQD